MFHFDFDRREKTSKAFDKQSILTTLQRIDTLSIVTFVRNAKKEKYTTTSLVPLSVLPVDGTSLNILVRVDQVRQRAGTNRTEELNIHMVEFDFQSNDWLGFRSWPVAKDETTVFDENKIAARGVVKISKHDCTRDEWNGQGIELNLSRVFEVEPA